MKKFLSFLIFAFFVFPIFAELNNSPMHIENPKFGKDSRYQIIYDKNIPGQEKPQEKNDSYKRTFSETEISDCKSTSVKDFLETKGFLIMTSGGEGSMSELSYKGYAGFCIKVYVDGIYSNDPTTGMFNWNSIDVSCISEITIEDIPSFGETEFAGCIVRITTNSNKKKILVDISGAGYQKSPCDTFFAKMIFSSGTEKFNYTLSTAFTDAKNQFERDMWFGTNKDNFSRESNSVFSWASNFSENLSLNGSNTFFYNKTKAFGSGPNPDYGIEEDINTRNSVNALYENSILKSKTSVFFNFGNIKYANDLSINDIDYTSFCKTGLSQTVFWLCDFYGSINYEWLPLNQNANRLVISTGASKKFSVGSAELVPEVSGLFWFSKNFSGAVLPRFTFSFKGLTLSAFRELTLPTFNQLYWPDVPFAKGNPDLKPESGWSFFAGFKKNDFPLWAQYKFSYYGNKIRWSSVSGQLRSENTSDAIYNIVTIGFNKDFFEKILSVSLDGTFTAAQLCSTGKQIMWVPRWQAHAGITLRWWKIIFTADYIFTSRRFTSNENNSFYPASHLINLALTMNLSGRFSVYFKVNNLLDSRIIYHDSYYLPSRKIILGVNFRA